MYDADMPMPDFQSIMLPLLREIGQQESVTTKDVFENLRNEFELTDEERKEKVPSGKQTRFGNRFGWARTYLKQAGLIRYVQRGVYSVTDEGSSVLDDPPERITISFLQKFPKFIEFRDKKREKKSSPKSSKVLDDQTPEERLDSANKEYREELTTNILEKISEGTPEFFERLVVDVLVAMGYGGNRSDAGRSIGQSGDEGIDGLIKEDALGLDIIYIQAKRWSNVVGRPEIQKFAGALQGQRARKGVFITTSYYSSGAEEYARQIESRIILIDGSMLAELMMDHGVGVSKEATYVVSKIDNDYFDLE